MKPKEFEEFLINFQHQYNNTIVPEFEGYSPSEMDLLINGSLSEESPVKILQLNENDYVEIPILNQIKYLLNLIEHDGGLKLTEKGFLPPKVVQDIYAQGFIKDQLVEQGIAKVYKETDLMCVNLTRILVELSGLAIKKNGKLVLTKKMEKKRKNDHELLRLIMQSFGKDFNWRFYDGYESENTGQVGFGFSLILLSKYGNKRRLHTFYADKYLAAFPSLISEFEDNPEKTRNMRRCYTLRTFYRFLDYFSVVNIEGEENWGNDEIYISKTNLFDKLFKIEPHKESKFTTDVSQIIKLLGEEKINELKMLK